MTGRLDLKPGKATMPQTTFWRFVLATLLLGLLAALGVIVVAAWLGRSTVHELHADKGYTVLRNVADLIGRNEIAVETARIQHLESRKGNLRRINKYTRDILDASHAAAARGDLADEEALQQALALLNGLVRRDGSPGFIIDKDLRLAVHPNPAFLGYSVLSFPDADGNPVFQDLAQRAAAAKPGEQVFSLYPWFNTITLRQEDKLTAALYYDPWDLVVCSDIFLTDVREELAEMRQANLYELRARINEIVIGRSGYVFFFDDDCAMIGHPVLADQNISLLIEPSTGLPICSVLKAASEEPWGRNTLRYVWDKPSDQGTYHHEKIAWCAREPLTGWHICVSAFMDELDADLPTFVLGIFLPSLGAILLLGAALTLLLKNLLRPVREMVGACHQVTRGDLTARASEDAHGEMGFLCRNFNMMIRRLGELRKTDEQRRKELEALNQNLEKIVADRTEDLRREALKLRLANERLRELDKLKSALLSSVSHELRTPLTSILGFTSLIKRDFTRFFQPLAEEDRKLLARGTKIIKNLEIIEHGGWRLTRLINDVLDLNRIESGHMEWRDEVVPAGKIILRCVQAAEGQFHLKPEVGLHLDVRGELPDIRVDVDRFEQVMVNLLSNAAKFTDSGSVSVIAEQVGDALRVEIRDTGEGISADQLEQIFEHFHQSRIDATKGKPEGTGLGLSISKQIIEHYQGRIWAESIPGQGSSLIFTLPLSVVAADQAVETT